MQKHRTKIAHTFLAAALFAFVFAAAHPFITHAGTPSPVLYMGKLTNAAGTAVPDGTYQMKFALYDEAFEDAACLWSAGIVLGIDPGSENPELRCAALASRKSISVTVTNGFFSANLGDTADVSDNDTQVFPTNLFDTANVPHTLYIGVTVCGVGSTQVTTSCTESEMTPRKPLTSAPFAQRAKYAERSSGDFNVGSTLTTENYVVAGERIGIGVNPPTVGLHLGPGKDMLGTGTVSFTGTVLEQAGIPSMPSKIIWNSSTGALRAGSIGDLSAVEGLTNGSTYWDNTNLGPDSFASGINNKVTGITSTAFGLENTVTGLAGAAFGIKNTVSGDQSFAAGFQATASSDTSIAIGNAVTASGSSAIALGSSLTASASNSIAIGSGFTNNAGQSLQVGFSSSPTMGVNSTYLDVFGNKKLRFMGSNSGSLTLETTSDSGVLNLSQGAGLEFNGSSNGYVILKAADTGGSSTLILPSGAGSLNQVLSITSLSEGGSGIVTLGWANNGGGSSLSSLTAATGDNTINNTNNSQQRWNFAMDGTNKNGLRLSESSASQNTGNHILSIDTLDGSTAMPLYIMSNGPSTTASIYSDSPSLTTNNKALEVGQTSWFDTTNDSFTSYGAYIINNAQHNTNHIPTLTNVGLYVSATNATNNYAAIFENGRVGIGTTTPSYDLAFSGNGEKIIGLERQASPSDNGQSLTLRGGNAKLNSSNQPGGALTLSTGSATGNGESSIQFMTAGGGNSGTSDKDPSTRLTIDGTGNTIYQGDLDIAFGIDEKTGSGPGGSLTVKSGRAKTGESNTNGGNLTLTSGIATGSGASKIYLQVPQPGGSGTSDTSMRNLTLLGTASQGIFMGLSQLGGDPTRNIDLFADEDQTIGMGRVSGGWPGKGLTINAGGGQSGGTNQTGGDLVLSSGISTGNETSAVKFKAPTPGNSGAGDNSLSEIMTVNGNGVGIGTTPSSQSSLYIYKNPALQTTGNYSILGTSGVASGTIPSNREYSSTVGSSTTVQSYVDPNGKNYTLEGSSVGVNALDSNANTISAIVGSDILAAASLPSGSVSNLSGVKIQTQAASGSVVNQAEGLHILNWVRDSASVQYGYGANIQSSGANINYGLYTTVSGSTTAAYGVSGVVDGSSPVTPNAYGGYFSSYGATNNIGLYATATGGTNNYAAIFENGYVGIGTTSPSTGLLEVSKSIDASTSAITALTVSSPTFTGSLGADKTLSGIRSSVISTVNKNGHVYNPIGIESSLVISDNANAVSDAYGTKTVASSADGTLTLPSLFGTYSRAETGSDVAHVTTAYGVYGTADNQNNGTLTTGYGGYFSAVGASTSIGLYATATGSGTKYAALFDSGNVGINNLTPSVALAIGSGSGTTAASGLSFGGNANLYRSGSNKISSDGDFTAAGVVSAGCSGCNPHGAFRAWDGANGVWTFGRDSAVTGNFVIATGNPTDVLTITTGGNFGFNTTSFSTSGAGVIGIHNASVLPDSNPTAGGILYADAGALKWRGSGGTITTVAAADYNEYMPAKTDVVHGDIVALSTEKNPKTDDTKAPFLLEKSDVPYDSRILGVVSSYAGDEKPNGFYQPVALIGRVPVKVTNEGGAIKTGDLLTSSTTPGAAMKATKSGNTIGIALQDFDSATPGSIIVFVNVTRSWNEKDADTRESAPVAGSSTSGSATSSGVQSMTPSAPTTPPTEPSNTVPLPAATNSSGTITTLGTPSFISGRAELTDALKEVTITLPTNFSSAVDGNYQAFITSTNTPAALFIASQTATSFTVRSMDGVSFGPFNWMALAGTTVASTTQQDVTPDAAGFENIPTTPGALTSPSGPLSDVLDSAPVQTTNDLIPPIAAASFAGFVVSSGVMVRAAGRRKGLKGYLKSFLALPSVLTRHSAQGFSRMATPNETGIIDHSYTRFARWHFAAQVLLLVGVNLLLVRAILGLAIKALA